MGYRGNRVKAEKCSLEVKIRALYSLMTYLYLFYFSHTEQLSVIVMYILTKCVIILPSLSHCVLPPLPHNNHRLTPASCDYLGLVLRPYNTPLDRITFCVPVLRV